MLVHFDRFIAIARALHMYHASVTYTHSHTHTHAEHTQGDCSYFRIRNVTTGIIVANVSQSLRHSFFAAVADHRRRVVWVFGGAHARGKPNL